MEIGVEFDFAGPLKMLKDISKRLEPREVDRFLVEEVGQVIREGFEQQFARGGYPEKWKPLAPSTIQQKTNAGYPRLNRFGKAPKATMQNGKFGPENILIRRGDLRISWTKKDGPDHVSRASQGVLEEGSSNPYAIYHQSDEPRKIGKNGKEKLPQRKLVITEETMNIVVEKTIDWIISR